jgi:hypothetical protein
VVLVDECDAVVGQFAHVPALRDAIQQRDELQREFTALHAAKTNFKEIARVGTAHKAAAAAVLQERLSEEDYMTLADRHAALVQKFVTTCEQLADAEDYDSVTALGAKLKLLNALHVSSLPFSRTSSSTAPPTTPALPSSAAGNHTALYAEAVSECGAIVAQLASAPLTREAILLRDKLRKTLTALRAAKSDFEAVGQAGKALKAVVAAFSLLSLSELDYLTLADRHAALVQKITTTCIALADTGEFDALDTLATKLEELKALDVSALPQSWANDPMQPPAPHASGSTAKVGEEDDGANDPVFVPPAPGISQSTAIVVPHAPKAISGTAEEGEKGDCGSDPVYMPPNADEISLA